MQDESAMKSENTRSVMAIFPGQLPHNILNGFALFTSEDVAKDEGPLL